MRLLLRFVTILLLATAPALCGAQSYLSKGVSVKAKDKKLEDVLNIIARQGGFFFSYNSNIVPADSIVSVDIWNKTVRQSLDIIFKGRFEYKEIQNHVIIQYPSSGQYWYVSGYVVDETTGERVRDVSVFESSQLVASLTNDQGYFRLKLKDKVPSTTINISKSLYKDTLIAIKPGIDQEVKVQIKPRSIEMEQVIISSKENSVEGTWFGNMFLSSKQKIQSINLNKFFVDMSFQGSLVPGVSSQGRMVSQTTNVISINAIGGYTAGVKGLEMGTVFNINKRDVKYLQVAGIVNVVGGNVSGVQGAGIHNTVMGGLTGVQMAGISNTIRKPIIGVQGAGIYNLASGDVTGAQMAGIANNSIDTFTGMQAAGIVNMSVKKLTGIQMAGVLNTSIFGVQGMQASGVVNTCIKDVQGVQLAGTMNFCMGEVRGAQLSGLVNYATHVRGMQFGLFNFAKKVDGVSMGLFSFVWNGYHKISVSANEMTAFNASVKTGTRWLYNIYTVGANTDERNKIYRMGMGWGADLPIAGRFSVSPELTANIIYLGNWAEINTLMKLQGNVNFRIWKYLSVFAGPSFNMYWDNKQPKIEGYATDVLPAGYRTNTHTYNLSSWIGWNAGVTIF